MMRRLRQFSVAFGAAVALSSSLAHAAAVTDVADAAEPKNPIDLNLDFRWRRISQSATVLREYFDAVKSETRNVTELDYVRTTHVLDLNLAVGIFHDLELHANFPYAVSDEQNWNYGTADGQSVQATSTLANNTLGVDGNVLSSARPIISEVPGRVLRGGFLDPTIGFAWGIFNGDRDEKLPEQWYPRRQRTATLVLGFDYTIPAATPINPMEPDLKPGSSNSFSMGQAVHKFDWSLSMSKRLGVVDPYLRLHYTLPVTSSRAYDNCDSVSSESTPLSTVGQQTCNPESGFDANGFWKGKTGLEFPHRGGMTVGAEFIAYEQLENQFRIGIQLSADFVSKGRTYTEMSDALRKLTYQDQYFATDARLTFDLRLSKYFHWTTFTGIGFNTPHFITFESPGKDMGLLQGETAQNSVLLGSMEQNPNYDFRLDQPGQRLLLSNISVFSVSTAVSVNF